MGEGVTRDACHAERHQEWNLGGSCRRPALQNSTKGEGAEENLLKNLAFIPSSKRTLQFSRALGTVLGKEVCAGLGPMRGPRKGYSPTPKKEVGV